MDEITKRFHRHHSATAISADFLRPDNVQRLVANMEQEAAQRKSTYGGKVIPTTYSVDDVYPYFESFVKKRFQPNTDFNQAFRHHAQPLIANDVQHWRYAWDKYNREQLAQGYLQTQAFAQPFRRRLAAARPQCRPCMVKKQKTTKIPQGFNNLNSKERRDAAMREAGLLK